MDRRFLTVLAVSLVFALVVSSIFYQMSARAGGSRRAENTDQVDVVVAAQPISVGVNIKPDDVKIAKTPKSAFPKGAFSKVEEVIDRPVISNILLDEPILDGRLAARGSGLGLAPIIPVGMRAVTVRVNDVVGVAGFVMPGMHVDVLITGRPPSSGDAPVLTNTVLQNITVLSAGKVLEPDARGQAISASSVTLLVTPAQAEILTLAGNETRIQLVLRNTGDDSVAATPGHNTAQLYKLKQGVGPARPAYEIGEEGEPVRARPRPKPVVVAQAALPPPPPPPPPPPDQIVVIRGNQKTVEVVGNSRASLTGGN